jgi:hypothetical protein
LLSSKISKSVFLQTKPDAPAQPKGLPPFVGVENMGIPDGGDLMTNLFRLSGSQKATTNFLIVF